MIMAILKKTSAGKKREETRKRNEVYARFWKIYDEPKIHIGSTMLGRIRSKHYKYAPMNSMTSLLEFLVGLYPEAQFRFKVYYRNNKSLGVGVFDPHDQRFVEYSWRSGKPVLVTEITELSQKWLAGIGVLSESLHPVRTTPIVVIE